MIDFDLIVVTLYHRHVHRDRIIIKRFILGAMTSFMVVTSPAVFKTLDEDHSKKFLRYIFLAFLIFVF